MNIFKKTSFWVIVSIIGFGFIAFSLIPKPIDTNLDNIGNGQKSVVFVYDANLTVSNQQTVEINKARETLGERVNFLLAKPGDPRAESFLKHHLALSTDLLFFNESGELVDRQVALLSAEELIESLSD